MDENFNQQNWGGVNNGQGVPDQGAGRPMPPPPPPPEITLRTMQSDIESVKQSGGESPTPKPFTPPELNKQPLSAMPGNNLSSDDGMIRPGQGDGVIPPSAPKKSGAKAAILIIVLILVLAAAAYVGYVYVYPMFAKPVVSLNNQVATTTVPSVENTVIPETLPTTTPESLATTTDNGSLPSQLATTSEGVATGTTEIAPITPIILPHASLLISQPDATATISLIASSTLASIKSLLVAEAANKPQMASAVKEVILTNQTGQPAFADIFSTFLPEFSSAELGSLFAEDFTTVMTYDKDGVWLGFVARLNNLTNLAVAKNTMSKIEHSANLANLYLSDPGKPALAFKDGTANGIPVRYLSFGKTGASLNYGWTNSGLFVISDSYNGMKALLTKLGIQ
ncbi:MAG: hypothetical protein M1155_03070 [Patescibacteria group bacterium]|nr:hypothetical protein [Patescibacteria group bacterium]